MTEFKSNFYKIEETKSMIEGAIKDAKKVLAQQLELQQIVENAERKEIKDDFVEGLKKSNADLMSKIDKYNYDLQLLDYVKDLRKENKEIVDEITTILTYVFGICPLELKDNNKKAD